MNSYARSRYLGFLILLTCCSCNFDDRLAETPHFHSITAVDVASTISDVAESHKISEVWTYADSVFIGAYPVPSTFPVLAETNLLRLEFFAGIRENGQSNSPVIYPFYETIGINLDPVNSGNSESQLIFHYHTRLVVALAEGFESGNIFRVDLDGNDESRMDVVRYPGLDGNVGRFQILRDLSEFEVASAFTLDQLPTDGSPVYLEIDYQSDVALAVGLRGSGPNVQPVSFYKIALFPTETRDKVYLNFSPDLQASGLNSFQVILRAVYDNNLPVDTQLVHVDNIKLLHF